MTFGEKLQKLRARAGLSQDQLAELLDVSRQAVSKWERNEAMPEAEKLATFAATGATLAIHLAIHALDQVVAELVPVLGADCPVAVVARATWPNERVVRGTLGDIAGKLADDPIPRTALILVGRALAAEDFRESALYDTAYVRRFRGGGE